MKALKGLMNPERLVPRATAAHLGAVRALVVGIVLGQSLWEVLGSSALLPAGLRVWDRGMMGLLHHVAPAAMDWFYGSYAALRTWELVTAGLLWLALFGLWTRWAMWLGLVGAVVQGGVLRSYGQFYHSGMVPLYAMAVLCLSPCGDGFSLDRLVRIARGRTAAARGKPAAEYAWSVYAVWMVVALSYVMAGACKLREGGLRWFEPNAMRAVVLEDSLKPLQFPWHVGLMVRGWPDGFFVGMAVLAVALELGFVLVLVSKWARRVLPVVIAGMHLSILVLQRVLFADMIVMQAVFYDWGRAREAIGRWVVRRFGVIEVLFDGRCGLCRRTVGVLEGLDLLGRLRFVDFRREDVGERRRGDGTAVSAADLEREMYVTRRGMSIGGYEAYVALAAAVPAGWVVWPVMVLPGVRWVGREVYARVARRRGTMLCGEGEGCAIGAGPAPAVAAAPAGAGLAGAGLVGARWHRNIVALALGMALLWAVDADQYPLTSMPMYDSPNTSGVIAYGKLLAHLRSGKVVEADPSAVIWAVHEGRYRKYLRMAFDAKRKRIATQFLKRCGRLFNDDGTFDSPVSKLEVQWWEWDFVHHPDDADYGDMTKRAVVEVAGAGTG